MEVEASDNRDAILTEAIEALSRLPAETLLPLLPWFGELVRERPHPLTRRTISYCLGRCRLLQRYAELRADPGTRHLTQLDILGLVLRDAPTVSPGLRCSVRSLQRWIKKRNAVRDDGLAGGVAGLIGDYGRPRGTVRRPQSRAASPVSDAR